MLEPADVCGVEWGYLDIEMFFVLAMFGFPNCHCLLVALPSRAALDFRNYGFARWKICETL